MKKSFFSLGRRALSTIKSVPTQIKEPMSAFQAQQAYEEAKELCSRKEYKQAIEILNDIEERFSNSSKAVCFLRGQAWVELLEEQDSLPTMTHMKV